jgi:hypothetical protein
MLLAISSGMHLERESKYSNSVQYSLYNYKIIMLQLVTYNG